MISIVDYGLGNVQAFVNIYKRLNIPVTVAQTSAELSVAQKIILPGVGSFDWAMSLLETSGMRECLDDLVLNKKCPVLGVCVGLQMMAIRSDEGQMPGLGWINADVKRFNDDLFKQKTHLPHMGWNDVLPESDHPLFRNMKEPPRFYFLHSYYFSPYDKESIIALTDYGKQFVSVAGSGNIMGVQFHPEKSHQWGIQLLKNFSEIF